MLAKSCQSCPTLWTVVCQAPLSMGFSRQEYWSGLPCPPPGDLPNLGIKLESLMSPALARGFFITSAAWEAVSTIWKNYQLFLPAMIRIYVQKISEEKGQTNGQRTVFVKFGERRLFFPSIIFRKRKMSETKLLSWGLVQNMHSAAAWIQIQSLPVIPMWPWKSFLKTLLLSSWHMCFLSQLCWTLWNPMDCSSSILGDSPGKSTGMCCHALL